MTQTIIVAIVAFLVVTLLLVGLLLFAKAKLTSSGAVTIDVNNGDKVFEAESGSTLLATLADNKIFLPSACGGGGACGMCKCQVLEGGGELLPTETGFIPDMGAIMAFIEASTGRKADVILGKPYKGIVDEALMRTGFALEEMAMVGDRLYTDVATGVNHGMTGILVLSGEATMETVENSDVEPHLIFGKLADMIPYL